MLFGLNSLQEDPAALYETGYFFPGMDSLLTETIKDIMVQLRPQMIPIVESFYVTDTFLASSIGNSYGDIYETFLEWARASKLNKNQVLPSFKEYMLPILKGKL